MKARFAFLRPAMLLLTLSFTFGVHADTSNGHGFTLVTSSIHSGGGPVHANVSSQSVTNGTGKRLAAITSDPAITGAGSNGHGQTLIVGPPVLIAQLAPFQPSGVEGDVNGDGIVSPEDAEAIFQCYLQGGCGDPAKTAAANLCDSGPVAITPADAQAAFSLFLGFAPSCP